MEVAISYELVLRVFRKRWAEMGFIKGFFHMLFKGIPFYATTQSRRVVRDMLRLKDLSLSRIVRGRALTAEQEKIIMVASQGKADERGIELDAYGGRVAIDEEEREIRLCRNEKEDREMKRLLTVELGAKGRIHLVGHFTIGVALKVGLEFLLDRIRR